MPRLMAAVYDPWMRRVERDCLSAWRSELLDGLSGAVLEVGAGTGANLPHYPETLTQLVLAEPDRHMRRILKRQSLRYALPTEIADASAAELPYPDGAFDAVVATLVFCSVPDPQRALAEIRRILKPDGRLVFLEHVAAEGNPPRLFLQRMCQPAWRRLAGNCHLTRETHRTIEEAGFEFISFVRESLGTTLPIVRPCVRGVARPQATAT